VCREVGSERIQRVAGDVSSGDWRNPQEGGLVHFFEVDGDNCLESFLFLGVGSLEDPGTQSLRLYGLQNLVLRIIDGVYFAVVEVKVH